MSLASALRSGQARPPARLTWQAVTVLFHSTILSGCRITSWYTSSAGQARTVWGRAGGGLGGASCAQAHPPFPRGGEKPARRPLGLFPESQTEQEAPEHARTPISLTHLQDECLAMKGNLDGVYSIPIFLWAGQKGGWRVGEGMGVWWHRNG